MLEPLLSPGSDAEKRLLQALEAGAPIRLACAFAGIHRDTYYAQRERDADFAERADRARAAAAIRNLALIQQAAPQDWRAAKEALILSFPEDFGKQRVEVEHSGPAGGPIQIDARELLLSRLAQLAERVRTPEPDSEPDAEAG